MFTRKYLIEAIIAVAVLFNLANMSFGGNVDCVDCCDTFNRAGNNSVETTEAMAAFRWFEAGETYNDDLISVDSAQLYMHYFNSYPHQPNLACNIGGFTSDYVDITVNLKPLSTNNYYYGGAYGIGYRLAAQNSRFKDNGGYYVQFNKRNDNTTANTITIWRGQSTPVNLVSYTYSSGFHIPDDAKIRVVADGDRHDVYVNDAWVVGCNDSVISGGKTGPGYMGVFAFYSILRAHNLLVKIDKLYLDHREINDCFAGTTNIPGALKMKGYSWNEVGDTKTGGAISIGSSPFNNKLKFHYTDGGSGGDYNLACNLADFYADNVDVKVDLTPEHSNDHNSYYGIGYRLGTANKLYLNSDGYYVRLDKAAHSVGLWYGNTLKAYSDDIANFPSSTATLRVIAEGDRHRVWINGEKYLDAIDDSKTTGGYVGVFAYYSYMYADDFTAQPFPSPAPAGNDFPLMLYSIDNAEDMKAEKQFGWNMSKSYAANSVNESRCETGGFRSLVVLPEYYDLSDGVGGAAANIINTAESYSDLSWWYLPEELRYWYTDNSNPPEYPLFKNWCKWVSAYDDEPGKGILQGGEPTGAFPHRPRIMYIAGNYQDYQYEYYVPYMDVIPSACYTSNYNQVPVWVRWRVEETMNAIKSYYDDYGIQYDNYGVIENTPLTYLEGRKTPIAICELFYAQATTMMTPEAAYHDFWQSIVSGARGIGILSYYYRNITNKINGVYPAVPASLKGPWDMYCKAASEITGPEQLGKMIMEGTEYQGVTISGAPTVSCTPAGLSQVTYCSIATLAKNWNHNTYVIAVNSSAGSVTASLNGLPPSATGEVLFEGRTITVNSSGILSDTWAGSGVHIYKFTNTN